MIFNGWDPHVKEDLSLSKHSFFFFNIKQVDNLAQLFLTYRRKRVTLSEPLFISKSTVTEILNE